MSPKGKTKGKRTITVTGPTVTGPTAKRPRKSTTPLTIITPETLLTPPTPATTISPTVTATNTDAQTTINYVSSLSPIVRSPPTATTSPVARRPKPASRAIKGMKRPETRYHIFVCGTGYRGELGLGAAANAANPYLPVVSPEPLLHPNLDVKKVGIVQLSVGLHHVAALTYTGKVLTWGSNCFGALGRQTQEQDTEKAWLKAQPKPRDSTVNSAATSQKGPEGQQKEGVTEDVVLAEGDDGQQNLYEIEFEQLSDVEAMPAEVDFSKVLSPREEIVEITTTDHATFALTDQGLVYGVGLFVDDNGVLGFSKSKISKKYYSNRKGTPPSELIAQEPTLTDCPSKTRHIVGGSNHILFLDRTGNVHALGAGGQGQLARRLVTRFQFEALQSRQIGITTKIDQIRTGANHSFAMGRNGGVWGWGLNNYEQTGVPQSASEPGDNGGLQVIKPEQPDFGNSKLIDIAGGVHHGIACTEAGEVFTWGRCDEAQSGIARSILDDGDPRNYIADDTGRFCIALTKNEVKGIEGVGRVWAGRDNCFVIDQQDKLWAWGYGGEFQTGFGSTDLVETPKQIKGGIKDSDKVRWVETRGSITFIGVEVEGDDDDDDASSE